MTKMNRGDKKEEVGKEWGSKRIKKSLIIHMELFYNSTYFIFCLVLKRHLINRFTKLINMERVMKQKR